MSGQIFLVDKDGSLVEMSEQGYPREARLQELLAKHPELLAGEQMDQQEPRRWVLVRREMGVPDAQDAANRWSLDHLFLDQEGVPTLVEVKRAIDTRARREVVAQMLDYAANATVAWPVEAIQTAFEQTCDDNALDADEVLADLLGADGDIADFWQHVKTNLMAGRIRLVFVGDTIAPELRRIVEFLNAQMNPAEVFAVEVKQYSGSDLTTLVPRVVGQSSVAQNKRRPQAPSMALPNGELDEDTFFSELQRNTTPEGVEAARRILAWARSRPLRIWCGRDSFMPLVDIGRTGHALLSVKNKGYVEFQLFWMKPPHTGERKAALVEELNQIPGIEIPEDRLDGKPKADLSKLAESDAIDRLLATADRFNQAAQSAAEAR